MVPPPHLKSSFPLIQMFVMSWNPKKDLSFMLWTGEYQFLKIYEFWFNII